MSTISFNSHGYKLAGNLFLPSRPHKLAFLLIQGWIGHQNIPAAQALAALGFPTMTYDMRGNGGSAGNLAKFSRADFVSDALTAYDYLKQHVEPGVAIGVVGSSFGSYTAILLTKHRPVACLSLRVPANYPDAGLDEPQLAQIGPTEDFKAWRQKKMRHDENHALMALHNFHGPVQIIRAGADQTVHLQVVENYASAVQDKRLLDYSVMENAPHRLANEQLATEYIHLLTRWAKQLPGKSQ